MWAFPVFVMLPRRSLPPLERSLGTTPMKAINSLGDRKRLRSMTSVMIVMAVMVSTPRSAQSGDGFSHFRVFGLLDDLLFDASDAFDFLLNGDDVFAEDSLRVALREGLRTDPVPVPRRPAFPLGVAPPQAQEELGEPVPPSQQVLPGILAGPQEIAQRFLRGGGDEDGGQLSQAVTPCEFLCVLAVGLDAVSGVFWG